MATLRDIINVGSMIGDPTVSKPRASDFLRANYAQTGSYMGGNLGAGQSPLFVQMQQAGYTPDDIAKALLAVDPSLRLNAQGVVKSTDMWGDPYGKAREIVSGQIDNWNAGAADRNQRMQYQHGVDTAQAQWDRMRDQFGGSSSQAQKASAAYWDARNAQQQFQSPRRPQMGGGMGVAPDWLRGNEADAWARNYGESQFRLQPQGGSSAQSWGEQRTLGALAENPAGGRPTLGRLTSFRGRR